MAKVIMVQGTMSNAGKSILVGGLCRVFRQDGHSCAPFKSQNMALNSFITKDGLEMGRAQVMQAEAAGIEPEVSMNPILLKPTSDMGSQVIVNGEVIGVMPATEYYRHKKEYIPAILEAYHHLEEKYDIIVIEGAGSPAEINLKKDDIVNMGLAELVDAPVLLVGDIDRGGVFAQIVGTLELLEENERKRVKGVVINKFRGDKEILRPGLSMLEERTQIPVTGVIPYFQLDIDEEDSLTERFGRNITAAAVDIAVIQFPRISNFTDFMALECMEGVSLRYVSSPVEFGNPDAVLLPGSKNTMADLRWMRQSGLEAKVLKHASAGKLVFGICGGYQMLGEELCDPAGVESGEERSDPEGVESGEERSNLVGEESGRELRDCGGIKPCRAAGSPQMRGLGLLPVRTVFEAEKTRTRVSGVFENLGGMLENLNQVEVEGYEIHMGTTTRMEGALPILQLKTESEKIREAGREIRKNEGTETDIEERGGKMDGACIGNIYGCYVHGIFDRAEVSGGLVAALLKQKGLDASSIRPMELAKYKEEQYDKLADIIRENLDMKAVYEILEDETVSAGSERCFI